MWDIADMQVEKLVLKLKKKGYEVDQKIDVSLYHTG